jgi:hypothetical protein
VAGLELAEAELELLAGLGPGQAGADHVEVAPPDVIDGRSVAQLGDQPGAQGQELDAGGLGENAIA